MPPDKRQGEQTKRRCTRCVLPGLTVSLDGAYALCRALCHSRKSIDRARKPAAVQRTLVHSNGTTNSERIVCISFVHSSELMNV